MRDIQKSIKEDRFPEFIKDFFQTLHPDGNFPEWAVEALRKVNIDLHVNCDIQNGQESIVNEQINT